MMGFFAIDQSGQYLGDVATNSGYAELREWLGKQKNPRLKEIAAWGYTLNPKMTALGLEQALGSITGSLRATAANLISLCKKASGMIIITDGIE